MSIAGVYAIYLTGSSYVYVGEAKDVEKRWVDHSNDWVYPNEAEYVLVREMPGASRKQRMQTERALIRLLKRKGFLLLSKSAAEATTDRWASYGPERRAAVGKKAKESAERRWSRMTPAERSANTYKGWLGLTPEQRSQRGRAGAMARRASMSTEQYREMGRKGATARWGS